MTYLIQDKNICKLILSASITRFGDSIETIAFSWVVYQLTGSLSIMGLVFALNFIPNICFSPFAGVYADRHNRKKMVVASDLFRGVNAIMISFFIFTHTASLWMIIGFSFLNSTLESFANPARRALYADIIEPDHFLEVTSISSSFSSAAELLGLGTAGIIVAFGGNGMAFAIDAATFLLSAMGIGLLRYFKQPHQMKQSNSTYLEDIKIGFKILLDDRLLLICISASALLNFFFTPINVLLPKYADDVLHMGVSGVSLIESSITLGMIVGGFLIAFLSKRSKLSTISITGFFMLGMTYFLLGLLSVFPLNHFVITVSAGTFSFLFGIAVPSIAAPLRTHIIKAIPPDRRGIISSVMGTTGLIAIPLGGALVALIGDGLSISGYFYTSAIGIFFLTGRLLMNKDYRKI